jgi:hypothetical protein
VCFGGADAGGEASFRVGRGVALASLIGPSLDPESARLATQNHETTPCVLLVIFDIDTSQLLRVLGRCCLTTILRRVEEEMTSTKEA